MLDPLEELTRETIDQLLKDLPPEKLRERLTPEQRLEGLTAEDFQKLSPEVRAKRDELELAIARLREAKNQIKEDDYYEQLEKLLTEVAQLYEQNTPKP